MLPPREKVIFFSNVGPLRRASFWPPSMVYISVIDTQILQITFLHDVDLLWAAFHVLHQHLSFLHGCCTSVILCGLKPDSVYIFIFKFEQSSYLISLTNSRPCRDLNPGPHQYQVDMLPIELSWLGFTWERYKFSQLLTPFKIQNFVWKRLVEKN